MSKYEFVQRGKILIARNQHQEAVKVCRLGLLSHPTLLEGRLVLGMALMGLARYDEVLAEMRVALGLDGQTFLGHLIKGEAFLRKGDIAQAVEVLEKARTLEPRNKKVGRLLREARAAREAARAPNVEEETTFVDSPETRIFYPANVEVRPTSLPLGWSAPKERDASPAEAVPNEEATRTDPFLKERPEDVPEPSPVQPSIPANESPPTPAAALDLPSRPRVAAGQGRRFRRLGGAVVLVGAVAVAGGLAVREIRFRRTARTSLQTARALASQQTYRGMLLAEAHHESILARREEPKALAALARIRGALAADFGEPVEAAQPWVAKLERDGSRDAVCARAYLARFGVEGGSIASAQHATSRFPDDPEAHYLLGRAFLYEENAEAAEPELIRSISLGPTALAYVALSVAQVALGALEDALASLDQALTIAPDHPTAIIERIRLLAQLGRIEDPSGAEALLETLSKAATSAPRQQAALSRGQAGWAAVALAELRLSRGDGTGAKAALAAAAELRPSRDLRFSLALPTALLFANDLPGARAEAERAVTAFPGWTGPRLVLARIALAEGKPQLALEALSADGARPQELVVRGQAKLALGDLDGATRDLDGALLAQPNDPSTVAARAALDLRRGDPGKAAARCAPVYAETPDPLLGAAYGTALRLLGDLAKARSILALAARTSQGRDAQLELARVARDEGQYAEARQLCEQVVAASPHAVEPNLELALLSFDAGDAAAAQSGLEVLLADAATTPDVLLECVRVFARAGKLDRAAACARRAQELPDVAPWRLAREQGRLLLAQRDARRALAELKKAEARGASDAETELLIIDASLLADENRAASQKLAQILKRFAGKPEADLARGRVHLGYGRAAEAVQAFAAADQALIAARASRRVLGDVRTWLGRAQHADGHLVKARASFEYASALDPSSADPHYYLGLVLYEENALKEARAAFERAVALNPSHAEARSMLRLLGR